jgi:prepilin-type N-terminal cleavage/methylation domain-containing protein
MFHKTRLRDRAFLIGRFPGLKSKRGIGGFTLIELLIVIAIILILIAIALPNFLEAQIRAKVTRAKGELRTIGIAQESYFLDFGIYPAESEDDVFNRGRASQGLLWLTSPIKYLTSIPEDPFSRIYEDNMKLLTYESGGIRTKKPPLIGVCLETYAFFTRGPDHLENEVKSANPHWEHPGDNSVDAYSPTNGTKSMGDIFIYGGDSFWIGVRLQIADRRLYNPSTHDQGLVVNGRRYLHQMVPSLQ